MKIRFLALIGKALGIQFKVNGLPYGATKTESRSLAKSCIYTSEERPSS